MYLTNDYIVKGYQLINVLYVRKLWSDLGISKKAKVNVQSVLSEWKNPYYGWEIRVLDIRNSLIVIFTPDLHNAIRENEMCKSGSELLFRGIEIHILVPFRVFVVTVAS